MNTFILKWDPAISSYKMDDFDRDFCFGKGQITADCPWGLNWAVWDHEAAHVGDRFFMLRVGQGENNGIVMAGTIDSEPYEDEDWSGKVRETFYVDLAIALAARPDSDRVLPASRLEALLPAIDWRGGHSGVLIDPASALTLEKAWYAHLKADLSPDARAQAIARIAHFGQTDKAGRPYLYHPLRVADYFLGPMRLAALLHDVVEDSAFTLDDLAAEGFSKAVVAAVKALTRKEGETYEAYIRRVGRNKIAREVKRVDLEDNMNLLRLPELTDKDLERIRRYHKAYRYIRPLCDLGIDDL